jgi:hypothetical protein
VSVGFRPLAFARRMCYAAAVMHGSAHFDCPLTAELGSLQVGAGVLVGIVIILPSAGGVHG